MSKKMLKRSLALGALMAFVITGSAMAEEFNTKKQISEFKEDTTYDVLSITPENNGESAVFSTDTDDNVVSYLKANSSNGSITLEAKDGNYLNGGIFIDSKSSSNTINVSAHSIAIKDVGTLSGIHVHGNEDTVKVTGFKNFSIDATNNGSWGFPEGNGIRVLGTDSLVEVVSDVADSSITINGGQSGVVLTSD